MALTVVLQFAVHFTCLVYLVQETKAQFQTRYALPVVCSTQDVALVRLFDVHHCSSFFSSGDKDVDLEKEFEQNELNSAVYLISIAMQISNFAVNYKASRSV